MLVYNRISDILYLITALTHLAHIRIKIASYLIVITVTIAGADPGFSEGGV